MDYRLYSPCWSHSLRETVQELLGDNVRSEKPTGHQDRGERFRDREFTREARAEDSKLGASL